MLLIRKWRDTREILNYNFSLKRKIKIDKIEPIIDDLASKILNQLTKTLFTLN